MNTSTLLAAACLSLPLAAHAATVATFSRAAFTQAQREGRPILIHITASWCPTCAAQRPILARLETLPQFRDLIVYNVDFDTRKDVVRAMGATMQSTLIAFHGEQETGRSVGDTDPHRIQALVDKTLG